MIPGALAVLALVGTAGSTAHSSPPIDGHWHALDPRTSAYVEQALPLGTPVPGSWWGCKQRLSNPDVRRDMAVVDVRCSARGYVTVTSTGVHQHYGLIAVRFTLTDDTYAEIYESCPASC